MTTPMPRIPPNVPRGPILRPGRRRKQPLEQPDMVAAVWVTASVAMFLYAAAIAAQNALGWSSASWIGYAALGCLFLLMRLLHEVFRPRDRR